MAYTKTIWENSPSENTPISAENLNNIENGISGVDTRLTTAEGEIDTAQTDIDNLQTGWNVAGETWTYASVDDPTGVITISGDKTSKYSLGMRIKFTNATNVIYGIITAISYSSPNTTLTFLHEIDPTDSLALHLMQNSDITNFSYSNVKSPYGFPLDEDKWSIVYTDYTNRSQINPTNGTWYNPDNISKTLPIGQYRCYWKTALQVNSSSSTGGRVIGTISTTNNSETISQFTVMFNVTLYRLNVISNVSCQHTLNLTTKTTFYFLIKSLFSADVVQFDNNESTMLFKATIAYL